jgi:cyclic beta-1,2-glucan synthetase
MAVRRVEVRGSPVSIPLSTLMRLFRAKGESTGLAERIRLAAAPAQQLTLALRWSVVENDERSYWISKLQQQVDAWAQVTGRYLHWLEVLAAPLPEFVEALGQAAVEARARALLLSPSLRDIAAGPGEALRTLLALRDQTPALSRMHRAWLDELELEFEQAKARADLQIQRLETLAKRLRAFADDHDFRFLYDATRHLFHIGTSVTEAPWQASHYDLLASEARLTSFIAIAKGDVPLEHWLRLGRPYASYASGQLLYSWSGTMFEHLMPNLFCSLRELLADACEVAVEWRSNTAIQSGVPWGISSLPTGARCRQTYQYMAFGVWPGIETDWATTCRVPVFHHARAGRHGRAVETCSAWRRGCAGG